MTYEEAINILHGLRPRGSVIPQKRAEMIDIADVAIRKQIPKKPVYYIFGKEKYPKCPCCGDGWNMNEYGNGMVHCWECGQAIDWSGEE